MYVLDFIWTCHFSLLQKIIYVLKINDQTNIQTNQATADYMEWLQVITGQTISDYKWLWARLWVTTSDNLLRVTSDYGWLQVSIRVIHVAGDCKWIGMTSNENEARIKNSSFTETIFLFKPIFYLLTEF